ncbi:hypothetical protein DID88_008304 [Monilinia fructigena]|uniref:Uncharacterized protein n=1 Tax=Monilinia fructigena TaxID=38457 RepID=A0A395JA03_9HELO|nr:hypothetical protein DID88_008304 [Monilinia fructigena]
MTLIHNQTAKSHHAQTLSSLEETRHVSRAQCQILHRGLPGLDVGGSLEGGDEAGVMGQRVRRCTCGAAGRYRDGESIEGVGKAGEIFEEECSCDCVLVDASFGLVQGGVDENGKGVGDVEVMDVSRGFVENQLRFFASEDEDIDADVDVDVDVRIRRSWIPNLDSSLLTPETDDGVHIEGYLSHLPVQMSMPILKLRQREIQKIELAKNIKGETVGLTDSESESKMVEPATNRIDEGTGKKTGSGTCSRHTPNQAGVGSETRSTVEHPTRQPHGPPPIEELRAKPTALYEGSKNFAFRARLLHAGMQSIRALDTHTKLESGRLNKDRSIYSGISNMSNQSPRPPPESLLNLPRALLSNPEPISSRYANLTGNQVFSSSMKSITSQIDLPSPPTTPRLSPPTSHPSSGSQEHLISATNASSNKLFNQNIRKDRRRSRSHKSRKG